MIDAFHDLCSTCNYAPDCVLRANSTGPIHYCEEFDNIIVEECDDRAGEISETDYADRGLGVTYRVSGHLEGLCCNCDNRGTCMYRRPEGGVWQCRQYQ